MAIVVANFMMIIVFMFNQMNYQKIEKDYHGDMVERNDDVHVKFDDMDKEFLTSYYRDEMKAKGLTQIMMSDLATTTIKEIQLIIIQKVQLINFWVMVVVMM